MADKNGERRGEQLALDGSCTVVASFDFLEYFNMQAGEFKFIQGLTADLSSKELVFPTSLNATMKIRRALNSTDISSETLARILSSEPVLSAHILRVANAVAFNPSGQRTSNLRIATARLGLTKVRNVAIWVGMKQLTDGGSKGLAAPLVDGLWNRTVRIAATSFVIAKRLTALDPESAMMAGLLHDIGKFYILHRAASYSDLFGTEAALWNIVDDWHVDIGASILENWEVEKNIRSAVAAYRDPERKQKDAVDLVDVLAAADFLDRCVYAKKVTENDWEVNRRVLDVFKLDKQSSELLMADARDEMALAAATFS